MGRVRENIQVNGKSFWALFDTSSRNTYVTHKVARGLTKIKLVVPFKVSLGGKKHTLREVVSFAARLKGKPIYLQGFLVDRLGTDEDGKEIQILFGALDMQRWGVRVLTDEERLDMSRYSREFVEY